MTDVNPHSQAHPQSRRERAAATRRRMMEGAYRLFSERGYAKTTMDAVADEAGVAVQTLYFTFHTKVGLLQAAYEYAVLDLEGVPPHLADWWRAAEAEPDLEKAVGHIVEGSLAIFERAAPLVWAVHGDEDARSAYKFNEELRVQGYAAIVAFLARKHPLRSRLSKSKARDIMLTILGPHVYFLLTRELGWSQRDFGRWAKAVILRELFGVETNWQT